MRSFDKLYAIAVERKGSKEAVEAHLPKAKTKAELAALPDNRWLAEMARAIFQAGFRWKVIEAKWPTISIIDQREQLAKVEQEVDIVGLLLARRSRGQELPQHVDLLLEHIDVWMTIWLDLSRTKGLSGMDPRSPR